MFSISINRLFPFPKLLKVLMLLSLLLQMIIITYSHYTGYYHVDDLSEFIRRLVYSTLLSVIASFLIAYPDLFVIRYLNRSFPWAHKLISRLTVQLTATLIIAVIISTFITLLANSIDAYVEDLGSVLLNNALITSVVNIVLMTTLEAWLLYMDSRHSKKVAETLERELALIRFEVLKSQINPHFLFNSLNVLSGLISKDVDKAQQFIDEFSMVYRYVLETIEKQVVTLGDELGFMRSYMFLQQLRYGEHLRLKVSVPSQQLQKLMPPLSLQLVLENAIKHNEISASKPLMIDIYSEEGMLVVKNILQPKSSSGKSTGMGQKNLFRRYEMLNDESPAFMIENNYYVAKLPLIDNDEP
ncbi:MAG TPA: histidine kinase [Prolixibacteraceae bacterium]|nr:histidine kinase [Prolixibacteraceae bacterium]